MIIYCKREANTQRKRMNGEVFFLFNVNARFELLNSHPANAFAIVPLSFLRTQFQSDQCSNGNLIRLFIRVELIYFFAAAVVVKACGLKRGLF